MTPLPAPAPGRADRFRAALRPPTGPWLGALLAAVAAVWALRVPGSGDAVLALPNFDLFAEFTPRHHHAGEALRSLRLPLWDPHQIAGLPFLATLQAGVLYPPNLAYAWLPTGVAMGWLALLHLGLAAGFSYGLARELGRSPAAACLAGGAFALGGSTLFLLYHPNALASAPWLPAALWCAARGARPRRRSWALWLGAVLALQFVAGRDFTFLMTAQAVALFAALQCVWMARDGLGAARIARYLAGLAVAGAVAAGLAAAQILPTLELAAASGRTLEGLEGRFLEPFGPMPPSLLFANLIHPAAGPLRREYLGWLPLLCFLAGFRLWGRDRTAVFAGVTALLALGLCLGSRTPLFEAYRSLPLAATFRLPDRFVFLFSFAAALGAACGFDRLFERGRPLRERGLLPGLALVAALAALLAGALGGGHLTDALAEAARPWSWFWFYALPPDHFRGLWRAGAYLGAGVLLLTLAARSARDGARWVAAAALALGLADVAFALRNPLLHPMRDAGAAVSSRGCYAQLRDQLPRYARHLTLRLPDSVALKDKDGELFATFSATHYDPLVTRRQAAYFAALQDGGAPLLPGADRDASLFMGFLTRVPPPGRSHLLDLLGVGGVLVDARPAGRSAALAELLARWKPAGRCRVDAASGSAPVALFRNPDALPRAWVVHRVDAVASPGDALAALLAPGFDPRSRAVVENPAAPAGMGATAPGDLPARVEIASYDSRRVVVRAETPRPGLLVLADSWDPDWSASLDGRPAPVLATNALFRGVSLPAGRSEVVFRYRPRAFLRGAAISAVAALLWAGALVALRRDGPRAGGSDPSPTA